MAWDMSNPLFRWKAKQKNANKRRGRSQGESMGKKKGRRSSGGGFGRGGAMLALSGGIAQGALGVGVAALAKRFIGAPLGGFTGAAAGFLVGGPMGAIGGYVHDNVGNVGGASTGSALL